MAKKATQKATAIGAATATATVLIGAAPPPDDKAADFELRTSDTNLLAAVNPWPRPDQFPDITGGLGTMGYNFTQDLLEFVSRAVVENLNLAALTQAAGLDLNSVLESLLGNPDFLVDGVLGPVLGAVPIGLGPILVDVISLVLGDVLAELVVDTVVVPALNLLGFTDANGVTDLLRILNLVGLDLSDPLNLAKLDIPGLNVITASPVFSALKLLGVDLGWVPSLPNAVARDINGTEYLELGVVGLLELLTERLANSGLDPLNLISGLNDLIGDLLGPVLPDLVHLRVPVTVGIGMGAFAIATGYDQVLAELAKQPGGSNYSGTDPVLGSITILPMLLALNPARPNGGLFSRFYPLASLLGINTVNPETQVESDGGLPLLPFGLSLGGANLLPILLDVGVQYHPLNDLAAWPNPFSLANNLAAALLPTYILRGLSLEGVTDDLLDQVTDALGGALGGNNLALNLYLTLGARTQPILEPLYLLSDVISLMTFGVLATNPIGGLANALAPALQALNNLGYTDVVRNPDGTYTRTLDEAGIPTPFFSFPSGINPIQAAVDVMNLLVRGFYKEFFSGNPTGPTPNVISNLLRILSGDILGGLLGDGV
ncbi:hypothetical protein JL15_26050, partial [Mycolicibacterium phlei DSM 43071]